VVDFVHLSHWPVFNLADVYVVAGAALLAWSSARARGPGWQGAPSS
jgi:lipoprotein signal peptidase